MKRALVCAIRAGFNNECRDISVIAVRNGCRHANNARQTEIKALRWTVIRALF
jgi:hypothetical protein